MYHVPLAVKCTYGWSDEGGEDGNGKEGSELHGESGDCLASCMQMTWVYVVSWRRT